MMITAVVATPNPSLCGPWIRSDQGRLLLRSTLERCAHCTSSRRCRPSHRETVCVHVTHVPHRRPSQPRRPCRIRHGVHARGRARLDRAGPPGSSPTASSADAGGDRRRSRCVAGVALERGLHCGEDLLRPARCATRRGSRRSRPPRSGRRSHRLRGRRRGGLRPRRRHARLRSLRAPPRSGGCRPPAPRAASAAARGAGRRSVSRASRSRKAPLTDGAAGGVDTPTGSASRRDGSGSVSRPAYGGEGAGVEGLAGLVRAPLDEAGRRT